MNEPDKKHLAIAGAGVILVLMGIGLTLYLKTLWLLPWYKQLFGILSIHLLAVSIKFLPGVIRDVRRYL